MTSKTIKNSYLCVAICRPNCLLVSSQQPNHRSYYWCNRKRFLCYFSFEEIHHNCRIHCIQTVPRTNNRKKTIENVKNTNSSENVSSTMTELNIQYNGNWFWILYPPWPMNKPGKRASLSNLLESYRKTYSPAFCCCFRWKKKKQNRMDALPISEYSVLTLTKLIWDVKLSLSASFL